MFTKHDIEIFIATHNRANLLKSSIESLFNQTVNPEKIIVLDNESTDNTESVVKSYSDKNIKYIKTEGFLGNYFKAKEIADKKYLMLFHDDDILHPQYLELVLKMLNTYENLSLITCSYTPFNSPSPYIPPALSEEHILFTSPKQWACYMYFIEGVSYAPAVYRTSDFLKIDLNYEKYNKFNDWPLLAQMSKYGNIGFFTDHNCIFARQHSNQDSNNENNYPNLKQIVNWDKCFFTLMGSPHWKQSLYWAYGGRNKHFILGKYKAAPSKLKKKYSIKNLKEEALKAGLPVWGWRFTRFFTKPITKYFIYNQRKELKHLTKSKL